MNTLVAVTPMDLAPAQQSLVEWVEKRITAVAGELAEATKELEYAISHKWRSGPLRNNVNRLDRRQTFYEKLRAAVQAGYVLMPSLQMSVMAIRTKAAQPKSADTTWSSWFEQNAQALPQGAGEYKNPRPTTDTYVDVEKNAKGEDVRKTHYFPVAFEDEFDMPVELCKPVLLERTTQAMALKVFDEIGVVRDTARHGDPIVCGTIIDPTRQRRRFAFFIAWALPVDDL